MDQQPNDNQPPCNSKCVGDFKKGYATCGEHGREEWEAIRSLCIWAGIEVPINEREA